MDGTALILCGGYYAKVNGKTAHGLVRGTDRYRVVGVVDAPTAGRDAGEVLDGRRRGIPIFGSLFAGARVSAARSPTSPSSASPRTAGA